MIEIRSLTQLNLTDLERVASGYTYDSKYAVTYTEKEEGVSFELKLVSLDKSTIKVYDYSEDETMPRYNRVLNDGFSFGAYDSNLLVGLAIAEPHEWNRSLWVWEFHVAQTYRSKGIGNRLMARVAEKAKEANLRTIVCETQNTNAIAIKVYRKLGFRVEGIDISYYSNDDYPDGEIAVFMKRRLQ